MYRSNSFVGNGINNEICVIAYNQSIIQYIENYPSHNFRYIVLLFLQ